MCCELSVDVLKQKHTSFWIDISFTPYQAPTQQGPDATAWDWLILKYNIIFTQITEKLISTLQDGLNSTKNPAHNLIFIFAFLNCELSSNRLRKKLPTDSVSTLHPIRLRQPHGQTHTMSKYFLEPKQNSNVKLLTCKGHSFTHSAPH